MNPFIKREVTIFLIVGTSTVIIDFSIYNILIHYNPFGLNNINVAKGIGFIGGAIFSYFGNRFWTFKKQTPKSGRVTRFALVYILGLIANITINYVTISLLSDAIITPRTILLLAFILAIWGSATLNFIGMKFFVFNNHKRINF